MGAIIDGKNIVDGNKYQVTQVRSQKGPLFIEKTFNYKDSLRGWFLSFYLTPQSSSTQGYDYITYSISLADIKLFTDFTFETEVSEEIVDDASLIELEDLRFDFASSKTVDLADVYQNYHDFYQLEYSKISDAITITKTMSNKVINITFTITNPNPLLYIAQNNIDATDKKYGVIKFGGFYCKLKYNNKYVLFNTLPNSSDAGIITVSAKGNASQLDDYVNNTSKYIYHTHGDGPEEEFVVYNLKSGDLFPPVPATETSIGYYMLSYYPKNGGGGATQIQNIKQQGVLRYV